MVNDCSGISGGQREMETENKVVELWRDRDSSAPNQFQQGQFQHGQFAQAGSPEDGGSFTDPYDAPRTGRWRKPLAIALCGGSALTWIAASSFAHYTGWQVNAPALADILAAVAQTASPLALAAVAWLLLMRNSRAEANGFARTTQELQKESQRIEALLAFVSARIDASRRELAEQSNVFLSLGDETAQRMSNVSESMRKEVETLSSSANSLKGTAAAARGDVAVLLSHLPKTQVQMRQIAKALVDAGEAAGTGAANLASEVAKLAISAEEAEALSGKASETLGKQVGLILDSSAQLCDALADAEERLDEVGSGKAEALNARILEISAELERIGVVFASRDEEGERFSSKIAGALSGLEARFATLGQSAASVVTDNAGALHDLEERSQRLTAQFQDQGSKADEMSIRLAALFERMERASAEMDGQLPQAFARLESAATRALQTVNDAMPSMAKIADTARLALSQLDDAQALIDRQSASIEGMSDSATVALQASQKEAEALTALIADAQARATQLSGRTAEDLASSLVQLRTMIDANVTEAERRLATIIPAAARSLGEGAAEQISHEIDQLTANKINLINATSERAASSARQASEHLAQQLKQIIDASAALETRVEQVRATSDSEGREGFARRTALLIESLNSSAIDVTKILSNDVTDTAWSAYLKGDRGIFARRAVKLINQSEAREIARHYQEDSEFCDQVNRYIHDYEAMLRTVMATREGTPLSIALLSSDTGKLYVALAQAIERLRT
jgi:hypothetical protein